mmetsp:Transcript_24194/g.55037  ORF Transcript_24194/g.55037 Transcript_24194/m.55037 type:complete len:286 (-) Transcript_24194:1281-2138(-)
MERIEELIEKEQKRCGSTTSDPPYLLFDFPGQIELFTHNDCVRNILRRLTSPPARSQRAGARQYGMRLCAVNLIDSTFCTDPSKFISAALLSTSAMIRLELPCVSVLSKIDLLLRTGEGGREDGADTAFPLDFYTDLPDLSRLVDHLDSAPVDDFDAESYFDDEEYARARERTRRGSPLAARHRALHERFCELVGDFNLVSFLPLNIQDAATVGRVLTKVDRANGYAFVVQHRASEGDGGAAGNLYDLFNCAVATDGEENVMDIVERYGRMREAAETSAAEANGP